MPGVPLCWDLPEEQERARNEAMFHAVEMVAALANHSSGNQSKLCIQK